MFSRTTLNQLSRAAKPSGKNIRLNKLFDNTLKTPRVYKTPQSSIHTQNSPKQFTNLKSTTKLEKITKLHTLARRYVQQSQSHVNPDPVISEFRDKGKHRRFRLFNLFAPSTIKGLILILILIEGTYLILSEPTITRPLKFWRLATPIWLNYRFVQWSYNVREKITKYLEQNPNSPLNLFLSPFAISGDVEKARYEAYEELHEHYAPEVYNIMTSLGGFYVKLGQMGSLLDDFLPPAWIKELERLQSETPAADIEDILAIISDSLEQPLDEIFESIEAEPLGAASIAQVHKGKLLDGREICVKVQFPGISEYFETDIKTVRQFCQLVQPEQLPFIREIERQFMTEFDFEREADHLQRIGDNLRNSKYKSYVRVPLPIREYTTKNVLVMEYLNGPKLVDSLRNVYARMAAEQNMSYQEFIDLHRNDLQPSSLTIKFYSTLFYALDLLNNIPRAAFNYTLGWFLYPLSYKKSTPPLNIPELMDTLVEVHGYQIIENGYFNADPHPGNILHLQDNTLGLIDFGQVKYLNKLQRALMAHLYIALESKDVARIANMYRVLGNRTKNNSDEILNEYCQLGFNYDDNVTRKGMNIQQYFENLHSVDPLVQAGDEWIMVSRLSILLRGLCNALQYPKAMCDAFAPIGRAWLAKNPVYDQWAQEFIDKVEFLNSNNLLGTPKEMEILEKIALKGQIILKKDTSSN